MAQSRASFTPKIYYFHPFLAGGPNEWPQHLARAESMGFDHVLTAPIFDPGPAGDIFLTAHHDRVHPALGANGGIDALLAKLAETCRAHGLHLLADIEIGRVAREATVAEQNPHWFRVRDAAAQRVDPRSTDLRLAEAALADFSDPAAGGGLVGWWTARLLLLIGAGVSGFRCINAQLAPASVWRDLIAGVAAQAPDCRFLLWAPGVPWSDVAALRDVGFDGAFSSLAWWDGRARWLVEEHDLLRSIGSVIASPEAPFGPRLSRRFDASNLPAIYRHQLRCAAALGDGVMVPMGFEFGISEDMEVRPHSGNGFARLPRDSNIDLTHDVRKANELNGRLLRDYCGGELRALAGLEEPVTALMRSDAPDGSRANTPLVVLINSDWQQERSIPISLHPLPPSAGAAFSVTEVICADRDADPVLRQGEVRLLRAQRSATIKFRAPDLKPAALRGSARIVIDHVAPIVDGGRFPARRIAGEGVVVEADIYGDGHDVLVAELLWRPCDDKEWRRQSMQLLGNDRWRAIFRPDRVGRYEFTIEAWLDRYATLCRDIEVKRAAGAEVGPEIAEARRLLEEVRDRTVDGDSRVVSSALKWLDEAGGEGAADILLTPDLREVMREVQERAFLAYREVIFPLEVERPQAGFGSWYELFPRSASDRSGAHGTFDDVIRRLPALRDMGFDVLYLPPIHPIGVTNRKGRNNALKAGPEELGSPYAIGSSEGGHEAIHPALGTIEGFRRLRDAAAEHGMELALDFAIQCSPDHPWLKQYPEWFNWRPDGSVRYAENPPKKYEDIVNVDFYAKEAIPALWKALRDIVLHWIDEGVRIFRVDNPHTKPLPFWEWMIAQVRARYPDVIFLSEAFTRPNMMYRLAKAGFSQSYTYFTWRNTKQEITEYFTELTTSPVKEFFRPHLFVNTPDINPYFLQTSGRPGFLIRAALAATLSGLWGMYSGFEICEAAPLPGREEYLDSEKYEIRQRNYQASGNIVPEISRLNRLRKSFPALQSHLGLRFYPAHNDRVLFYGKPLPAADDMILVAVSLDPFNVQETTIEIPLWEWKLPDSGGLDVQDLMRDAAFIWHGKLQRIRLDPAELPFSIWRIAPRAGG